MLGIPLLDDIEKNRLKQYVKVKRMNDWRLTLKYLDYQQAGKIPVGRQCMKWKKEVDEALRIRGTSLIEMK